MEAAFRSSLAALGAFLSAYSALAQEQLSELTPAGKAILKDVLSGDRRPLMDPTKPAVFPLPMCTFRGGLCGAVHRDGTVAVPPRYDWVGTFADGRAAVRLGGLYGFVDEDGREIVKPQYAIVDDFKFGFAQFNVDGKSGLIDRNGRMAVEPKYGFIEAIGRDRFRVSDERRLGGLQGGDEFSGSRWRYTASGGISWQLFPQSSLATGVIDISGQWIEPKVASREFDKDDPSLRWVQKDKLWGLQRANGTWLVEPKFQEANALSGGLARVMLNGKVGFIDRMGNFAIAPVFDKAWWFLSGFDRTSAARDGVFGVIDRSGAWVFQTDYQQVHFATHFDLDRRSQTVLGWHFKRSDRWGLLDLDGRIILDADFDQTIHRCADGRFEALKDKEWLYFKADGSPLQPPNGRIVDGFCGSNRPYALKIGDKIGLVDTEGNPVTPVQFDAMTRAGPDARNAKISGKWGRIALDGRWLLEPKFDYLSSEPGLFVAAVDGKRGFMRSDGTWLIEPKFDAARIRDADTAFVMVSGATGVLRLKDQTWAIPPHPGTMCDINNALMSQAEGNRAILSPAGETWIDIGAERVGINLNLGLLTFLRNGKWVWSTPPGR
jgi:WG containing repeat